MEQYIVYFLPAVVLVIVYGIFTAVRRQRQQKQEAHRRAGFFKVDQLDPELVDRIGHAYTPEDKKVRASDVYRRSSGAFDLYVMNITEKGADEGDGRVAVMVHRGWNLPQFFFFPSISLSGFLGRALNKLLTYRMKKAGMSEITLPGTEHSDQKTFLISENPSAVRATFPDSMWSSFVKGETSFYLRARGDVLVFTESMLDFSAARKRRPLDHDTYLRRTIDNADQLWRVLNPKVYSRAGSF